MNTVEEKLKRAQKLITKNISTEEMLEVLKIIGVEMTADEIESYRLWGDYMPLGDEHPYTKSERYLHILWELIDKVPLGINCTFAIPFRQTIHRSGQDCFSCGDSVSAPGVRSPSLVRRSDRDGFPLQHASYPYRSYPVQAYRSAISRCLPNT